MFAEMRDDVDRTKLIGPSPVDPRFGGTDDTHMRFDLDASNEE